MFIYRTSVFLYRVIHREDLLQQNMDTAENQEGKKKSLFWTRDAAIELAASSAVFIVGHDIHALNWSSLNWPCSCYHFRPLVKLIVLAPYSVISLLCSKTQRCHSHSKTGVWLSTYASVARLNLIYTRMFTLQISFSITIYLSSFEKSTWHFFSSIRFLISRWTPFVT